MRPPLLQRSDFLKPGLLALSVESLSTTEDTEELADWFATVVIVILDLILCNFQEIAQESVQDPATLCQIVVCMLLLYRWGNPSRPESHARLLFDVILFPTLSNPRSTSFIYLRRVFSTFWPSWLFVSIYRKFPRQLEFRGNYLQDWLPLPGSFLRQRDGISEKEPARLDGEWTESEHRVAPVRSYVNQNIYSCIN